MRPSASAASAGRQLAGSKVARRSFAERPCSERSSGGAQTVRLELDAVRTAASADEAFALELVECSRHGLASGADHLPEEIVGQRKVETDPVATHAPVLPRELDQLLPHTVDVVKPGHAGDRAVLLAERLRKSVDEKARAVRRRDPPV